MKGGKEGSARWDRSAAGFFFLFFLASLATVSFLYVGHLGKKAHTPNTTRLGARDERKDNKKEENGAAEDLARGGGVGCSKAAKREQTSTAMVTTCLAHIPPSFSFFL